MLFFIVFLLLCIIADFVFSVSVSRQNVGVGNREGEGVVIAKKLQDVKRCKESVC